MEKYDNSKVESTEPDLFDSIRITCYSFVKLIKGITVAIKCPKCNTDNPSDSKCCKECAMPPPPSGEASVTKILETVAEGLKKGSYICREI